MRKAYKDAFLKKHNIKLGFMSAFVKASAYALMEQPSVNGGKLSFNQSHIHVNMATKKPKFCLLHRQPSEPQCTYVLHQGLSGLFKLTIAK